MSASVGSCPPARRESAATVHRPITERTCAPTRKHKQLISASSYHNSEFSVKGTISVKNACVQETAP
eukprot:SAG25_NODE_7486_length_478_cov_0.810026_1_plen_66_part_10